MKKIRRFLGIFVSLFIIAIAGNVHAAGYTCDSIKQYTACNPGYYMTLNGTRTNYTNVGNKCTECPVGHYCTGDKNDKTFCPANTYRNEKKGTVESSCYDCATGANGQYSTAGSTSCTDIVVSISGNSLTYNGSEQTCGSVSVTTPSSGASVTYSTASNGTFSSSQIKKTAAGTYTIYYQVSYSGSVRKTGNYTCTIATKDMTVSSSAITLTYNGTTTTNGTAQSCANVTVSTPSSGATIKYGTTSGTYNLTSAPTLTNVGSTTVYYQVTASNYTTKTGSYKCTMVNKAMTVSAPNKTLTYNGTTNTNGTAQSCANVTVTTPSSGASITYSTSSTGTYSATAPTLTNVGSTTVYYKVTGSNFTEKTGNYTCTMAKRDCTITVKDGSTTIANGGSVNLTYPTAKTLTVTSSNGATVSLASGATAYVTASSKTLTPVKVGSSTITATASTLSNFNTCPSVSFTATVNNGTITTTETAKSKTYDGSALTCNGVTVTAPASGATIKYGTVSGTYNLTSAPTVTNVANSKTIYYQVTATNYTTKTGSFTCTIQRAPGSINTIAKQTLTYPTAKTVTVTRSGDGAVSCTSGDTNVVTCSASGTTLTLTPKKAGSTTVTVNVAQGSNHTATSTTFTVDVNRGTCTVTLSSDGQAVVYPGNPSSFTATTNSNGALSVTSDEENAVTATISNGTVNPTLVGVGEATLTITAARTDQYESCKASHVILIDTTAIPYTKTDVSKVYNGSALICNGITVEEVSGATIKYCKSTTTSACTPNSTTIPTVTNVADSGTVYYTISKPNYIEVSGNFKCTVTNATIKVSEQSVTEYYTGSPIACNGVTVTAPTSGATIKYGTTAGTYNLTSAPTITNYADAKRIYYQVTAPNYATKTGSFTCEIFKADCDITIKDGSTVIANNGTVNLTYPNAKTLTATSTSGATVTLTPGDKTIVTSSGKTLTPVKVGSTTITAEAPESDNYMECSKTFTAKVNGGAITATASAKTLTYNGTTPTNGTAQDCANVTVTVPSSGATVTYCDSSYNNCAAASLTNANSTLTNAGSKTIYYKVTATNYAEKTGTYTCTMNPRPITVEAQDKNIVYNGNPQSCTNIRVTMPTSGASVGYKPSSSTQDGWQQTINVIAVPDENPMEITYQVTAPNFKTLTGTFDCHVEEAPNTLTTSVSSLTLTYPTAKTFTVSNAIGAVSVASANTNIATVSGTTTVTVTPKAVGETTVTVTAAGASRTYKKGEKTVAITVQPGTIAATANAKKLGYTGNAQSCANVTGVTPSGATVTYSTSSTGTYASDITKTDPGSYTIYYKITAPNYTEKTGSYACTINRVVINPTSGNIVYRPGAASTTTTVTTNTGGGTITATSNNANITTGVSGNTITMTSNGKTATNATITVTSAANGNYAAASTTYTLSSVTCGDGYYNKSGTCTACPENATACGGSSNPTTFTCDAGYTKNAAGDACEPAEYTVTYNCGTGTGTAPTETTKPKYNSSTGYTPKANTCTKAGYEFAGWLVSGTTDIRDAGTKFIWKYTENKTFTAQWDAIGNYTATYSCGDGTGTAPAKDNDITFNGSYTIKTNGTSNCTRTGYDFAGWSDGSKIVSGTITWTYTTSKTFTAQWTPKCFAITVNSQSATTNAAPATVYLKYATGWYSNSTCTTALTAFTTKAARTGYTLGGFYTSTNGGGTQVANNTGNGTFLTTATALKAYSAAGTMYAKWTANTYTISYTLNSGTQAASGVPSEYTFGVGATISGKPTRVGYLFDGWCTNSGLTENCKTTHTISTTETGNKTFYAKWASCPANATCTGNNDFTCPENYTKNEEARTCTLGTLDCVAGKYYPGTGTSMVDCKATDGYYCPGTGKTGINGGAGCRVACPTSANGGTLTTKADNATAITQCRETLTGVQIPKSSSDKTGTANTVCEYTGGIENGSAVYEKDCSFTVTSCIAGYYVPVKSESPYSKQGTCEKVGTGNYRAAGTCNANPTKTNDTCMFSTCPGSGTTAGETSSVITDCYISCATESIKDGSTPVGSRTPVKAILNYSGSAYPACTYNLTCADGYDKKNEGTSTATCVARIVTVTLSHDGGTGGTTGPIYAQYNHGWYSNSTATTSLAKVNVPTKTNYTFGGYQDANNNKIINADGTFVESKPTLTANIELTAIWQGVPVTCVAGKYYTGTGTTMAPCRSGEYCPGEGAAGLEKAYQGSAGCFIKCPKSALNGTLSSDAGATKIDQCKETLNDVEIEHGIASSKVCYHTSGTENGKAVYEQGCSVTVKSCDAGYYVPIKTESPYAKQGKCEIVQKGYYRTAEACNTNPTKTNDTCLPKQCPTGGTTDGPGAESIESCFKECQKEDITKDGKKIGERNPVTDAQGNSRAALIAGTQTYAACYYNASCATGYVAQPENSDTGSTNATCVAGAGWSVTYIGEGTTYTLTGNPIRNFTVDTSNRTLPTAANVIRTGYTFAGWYEDSNMTGTKLTAIPADRLTAITLYAAWTPKIYQVTVDSANGTANKTIYLKYETGWYNDAAATTKLTKLDIPNGSGDEFGGYYYNTTVEVVNASGEFVTNSLTPADNMTIVAKWLSQPITCPAGKYYPGTGDINSCKPCESGYYCEGTTKCNSNDGKNYCGRTECPGHAVAPASISSQASATAKTQCINNSVAYSSDAKHVKSGTASCPSNADGAYNYDAAKCTNHNVTICEAGYYQGTSTAADSCEAVGKGYWSNGESKGREQCAEGTIHVYSADGVAPTTSSARGTTTGTTSTSATACFLESVPFTPAGAHGKGTQTCSWNGFANYDDKCDVQVIKFCDAGYYRKNATDKECVPAGADRYSTEGSLISEQCPARTDADGNVKNGETAISADTTSGKVETATNPGACMLRVPYDVPHGTGTKLCEFNSDSVDQTTGVKGQYDKNCSDREITSCDGGYYRQAGATDACIAVGQNYYRPAGRCTGSGETDTCMRIACPSNGLTSDTVNTAVTACYKTGLSYISPENHVTQGTQTCSATTAGQYTSSCRDFNITKCSAGYYHAATTAADKCEAVGTGYWSDGSSTSRTQCAEGTIHVYSADGVTPTTSNARGTTTGTTSTTSTACYLEKVPYTPNGAHGKGTQTCTWDGFASYSTGCTNMQIRYCDGGYYRKTADAKTCEAAGMNHYSTEGALNNEICPARVDANGETKNGETTTTTASSPEACVLRVPYDVPHGAGTKLCEFNTDSVNNTTGVKGQYDKNCSDKVIISCDGGYYRPVTNGVAVTDACVAVGQNYYRPAGTCTGSGASDTCMRIACPANGKTTGTTSTTSKDCYLEKLSCLITNGSGQNTCHHDGSGNQTIAAYSSGCTECQMTACNDGYSKSANMCIACPVNKVCSENSESTCTTLTDGQYTKSDAGNASISGCYRDCALGAHATSMTGRDYYGNNQCKIAGCESGYILSGGKCQVCPEGSFCPTDNPADKVQCPADWSYSDGLATKKENCYRKCEAYKITGGTALPVNPREFWPAVCQFEGMSDNGNECDIVNGACQETSCRNIYELVNGTCVPCNREHALSYLPRGNCMVASCEIGYHPNGQSCEFNVKTCNASNAVRASQTWDSKLGTFSTCMIEECAEGYHIASNACVTNEQVCAIEHGVGVKEWNTNTNSWGECVATSCDAGYTNDPTETNERSKQCGQCKNRFSILGETAVSTYIRGCEIGACLYQGELYNLENNECVPICEVNGYEDDTGTRKWDASRKKCVRTCKEGYTTW